MFGRKKKNEISVKLDKLPALTEQEQLNLVEIEDKNVISRVASAVPGAAQALANTAVVAEGVQLANAGVCSSQNSQVVHSLLNRKKCRTQFVDFIKMVRPLKDRQIFCRQTAQWIK